jgi:hypothetical protein
VVRRGEKNYTLKVTNRDVTVSVDCLKPAFTVPEDLEQRIAETRNVLIRVRSRHEHTADQTNAREENDVTNDNRANEENTWNRYVTHSGRRVRFLDWFQAGFS